MVCDFIDHLRFPGQRALSRVVADEFVDAFLFVFVFFGTLLTFVFSSDPYLIGSFLVRVERLEDMRCGVLVVKQVPFVKQRTRLASRKMKNEGGFRNCDYLIWI